MEKIINKKLYNTEKSIILTSCHNGLQPSDFRYKSEELYITKSGDFFLAGEEEEGTKYAECYGGSCSKGQKIIPLTKEETYKWLVEKEEIEIIEEYFGSEIQKA